MQQGKSTQTNNFGFRILIDLTMTNFKQNDISQNQKSPLKNQTRTEFTTKRKPK